MVVIAESEQDARLVHPRNGGRSEEDSIVWSESHQRWHRYYDLNWSDWDSWVRPDQVEVKLIGLANDPINRQVVLSSFRAG